jgi:hypothetical protein
MHRFGEPHFTYSFVYFIVRPVQRRTVSIFATRPSHVSCDNDARIITCHCGLPYYDISHCWVRASPHRNSQRRQLHSPHQRRTVKWQWEYHWDAVHELYERAGDIPPGPGTGQLINVNFVDDGSSSNSVDRSSDRPLRDTAHSDHPRRLGSVMSINPTGALLHTADAASWHKKLFGDTEHSANC